MLSRKVKWNFGPKFSGAQGWGPRAPEPWPGTPGPGTPALGPREFGTEIPFDFSRELLKNVI